MGYGNIDRWPNPTCQQCHEQDCYAWDVRSTTKNSFRFNSRCDTDASHYTKLSVSGVLNVIPTDLFTYFNNVNELIIDDCHLTTLEVNDFKNGNKLNMVKMVKNSLTLIVNNAFQGAERLETLRIEWNRIKTIEPQAFHNLNILKYLDLSRNEIETVDFLSRLNNLEILYLQNNQISQIARNSFTNMPRLDYLNLRENCLFTLDLDIFAITSVSYLFLNKNYLDRLPIDKFNIKFPRLVHLQIEENNFNCSHLRDIVSAVGERIVRTTFRSDRYPNVNGMECNNYGGLKFTFGKCLIPEITTITAVPTTRPSLPTTTPSIPTKTISTQPPVQGSWDTSLSGTGCRLGQGFIYMPKPRPHFICRD